MKQLILDHYRRWWWMLGLCALFAFRRGWFMANRPSEIFEFSIFQITLWAGSVLLGFDLKGGALRPVALLPLAGRQIGRGWWLATVLIPATGIITLLFSGAASSCLLHAPAFFPAGRLLLASLFTLVWLGMGFTMIINAARAFGRTSYEYYSTSLIGFISVVVFFGTMLFCLDASKSPVKSVILLGSGALLTVVGWVLAEQFEPGRASLYLGRIEAPNLRNRRQAGPSLTPLQTSTLPGLHLVPAGYGAIPFLLKTACVRAFLYLAAMVGLTALLSWWLNDTMPREISLRTFAGTESFMLCGFLVVFQLLPVVRQLRLLRTLPISAAWIALALLAVMIVPLLALGALSSGVALLALGAPAAFTFWNNVCLMLIPASLCVIFAAWLGEGKIAYVLFVVILFGFQQVQLRLQMHLHSLELPFELVGPAIGASVLLGFVLTRQALLRSRRPYRAQEAFGLPWDFRR